MLESDAAQAFKAESRGEVELKDTETVFEEKSPTYWECRICGWEFRGESIGDVNYCSGCGRLIIQFKGNE